MSMKLSELRPGQRGRVLRVGGEPIFRRRLQEMGIVMGSDIELVEVAPFGDPIKLRVPAYELSIRRRDASQVEVDPTE